MLLHKHDIDTIEFYHSSMMAWFYNFYDSLVTSYLRAVKGLWHDYVDLIAGFMYDKGFTAYFIKPINILFLLFLW